MKSLLRCILLLSGLGFLSTAHVQAAINPSQLSWSVQYLIDQSQTVLGKTQSGGPRDNRGLALSPDGRYLYTGYNNPPSSTSHPMEIRKIDLTQSDYTNATVAILYGNRGKALATDDLGRVYMAEGSDTDPLDGPGIHIYNAALTTKLFDLPIGATYGLSKPEGIAVTRESGALVLYATDRNTQSLYRFVLSEGSGDAITGATRAGLTGTGVMVIPGANNLRGVEVDASGRIWMADGGVNLVFRIQSDGTGLVSTAVSQPFDLAFDDTQVFVTQTALRTIAVLKQSDLSLVSTVTPPWASLKLDPTGGGSAYLAGIVIANNSRLYVTNEHGSTANTQSTYGRCDAQSDNPGGTCTITDLTHYDKEPILTAAVAPTVVELETFRVQAKDQAVVIQWRTANELDITGFRLWRKTAPDAWQPLTPQTIAPKHPGGLGATEYQHRDTSVARGTTYRYKLEILHSAAASTWSPVRRVTTQ